MLIPVVMAGGTGSRLWPVSRESFPKQFVSFHGSDASLFQQTLKRLEGLEGLQAPIVLCNENHRLENPADEPVVLIEVQCGTYLGEDYIERFEDVYGRIPS